MISWRSDRPQSLIDDYCAQLGTLLSQKSSGFALLAARQHAIERMQRAEAAASAKATFLAHMSHELRTPVHGIMGMLELARRTEAGPKQEHLLETAHHSADTLLGIINGVLDLSKLEAGKLELQQNPFDLCRLVEEISEAFFEASDRKGLRLSHATSAAIPKMLIGDPGRLRQILTNLVGNAIKFTDRGSVCINIHVVEVSPRAAMIRFEISDTGIGISPDHQRLIFDPFVQADGSTTRRHGGTGLGLSIAKQLCEMMGAVLEVTSEPGLGSTFRFTVRFSCWESENQTDSAVSPLASKSANCLISSGSARVLLVEDNPVNLEVALALLEETGCKVDTATNGVEALGSFGQTEYDMIFMDCQMPEMDGLEATRQIRRLEDPLGRRVPIIALTASAIDGDREACLATGMDDYLPKPFTPEQIRSVVGRWSSRDEKMLAV